MALHSEMIAWFDNSIARQTRSNRGVTYNFAPKVARKVRDFHKTMPDYRQTPLTPLKNLASHLGVARIWVKDESHRFGLNAFKVLGASYALTSALAEKLDLKHREMSFPEFQLPDIQAQLRNITWVV